MFFRPYMPPHSVVDSIAFFNTSSDDEKVLSASHAVKKIASKEPSGKAGVQPVCGGQARRGEWPIMIHLEISQHAVVEVRYL